MKHIITVLFAAGFVAALSSGCDRQYTTYSDAEYVMFTDTMSVNMVLQDQEYFAVPVAATTACDYDRNFGVEIIDKNSKAIEGLHYRLQSNTITIPAGNRATEVRVYPAYGMFESGDTLNFSLRLVMPQQLKWDLYGDTTHVKMVKSCPFQLDDFTGWCLVTSMFLNSYPGVENQSLQRLVRVTKDPSKEHTVILHDWLFTGYDVTLTFDPSDPANPIVSMDPDQVLSDTDSVFGQPHGDGKILVSSSPANISYFNACDRFVSLWIWAYVEDLGTMYGTVGTFYNILEWISDEEAELLRGGSSM